MKVFYLYSLAFLFQQIMYDFKVALLLLLLLMTYGDGARRIVLTLQRLLLSSDLCCRNFNLEVHVDVKFFFTSERIHGCRLTWVEVVICFISVALL